MIHHMNDEEEQFIALTMEEAKKATCPRVVVNDPEKEEHADENYEHADEHVAEEHVDEYISRGRTCIPRIQQKNCIHAYL